MKQQLLVKAKQDCVIDWLNCLEDRKKEIKTVPVQLTQLRQPPLLEDLDTMYDCRLRKEFVRRSYDKPVGDVAAENFFVDAMNYANETLSGKAMEAQQNIVAVIGHPGVGKTTLTKNILRQMLENGLYDNPDFVFYLIFRDIDYSTKTDLLSFLTANSLEVDWKSNQSRRNAVLCRLKNEKVVIILDGLDEAVLTEFNAKISLESLAEPETFIKSILRGQIFSKAKKLVTSRPRQLYELSRDLIPKFVVNISGIDEDAQRLLCQYVCGDKSNEVFEMIENQPDIVSYCFVPAICTLVMHCTNHLLFNKPANSPKTITSIFMYVLALFAESKLLSKLDLLRLQKYAKLAWQLFRNNKYYFSQADLDKAGIEPNEVNAFLVTTLARGMLALAKGDPAKRMYFTHLLWQELLVAIHLLFFISLKEFEDLLLGKDMDIDFMESRMEMVAKFLFGICNQSCVKIMEEKFELSISPERSRILKQWALNQLQLLLYGEKWNFQLFLPLLSWAYEMNDSMFSRDVAKALPSNISIEGEIHPMDITVFDNLLVARNTLLRDQAPFTIIFDKGKFVVFVGNSLKSFFKKIEISKAVDKVTLSCLF